MVSCGSFPFGGTRMPPPQPVRGSGCLFSNSLAPGFAAAAAAARPLACCLPAEPRGSPSPKACSKWGLGARPGARGRHGRKVQSPGGGVPRPSAEEKPKILLSFQLQRLTRPPALPPSVSLPNYCLALGRGQLLRLRCSRGRLQTCPRARSARQVHVPGQVPPGTSELSGGAAGAAASSFRGRRIPSQRCSPARPRSDSALRT